MSNISFTACGRCARTTVCEPITTGSVGLSVSFAFDAAWIGLQKTAIFRGSGMAVDLVLSGDSATVPPEVLTIPGGDLRVGVWGADPDGNVIIPTVWATVGEIVPGAAPSGIDPQPPAPSWAAQVQEIAQNALNTANSVREDADAGEFDGATYTPAVSAGGDLSWTNDKGKPNPPTVNIKGQEGQPGQTGATPDISIGTVTTGAAGSQASATMTGTPERPVLNLTIPKGDPGEVTQAEFAALSEEVADQKSHFETYTPHNLYDYTKNDSNKYLNPNGVMEDYNGRYVTDYIPAVPGKYIVCSYIASNNTTVTRIGYSAICCFDENKNVVPGGNYNKSSFLVPNGVAFVRITVSGTMNVETAMIENSNDTNPTTFEFFRTPTDFLSRDTIIYPTKMGFMSAKSALSAGERIDLPYHNVKNGNVITFTANITSFSSLKIGKSNDAIVTVDSTNIIVHSDQGDYTEAHGLTIENNLQILITNKTSLNADVIRITSNGISHTVTGIHRFLMDEGNPFVESVGSALTDAVLSWTSRNINKPIWLFGDSYFSWYPSRWTYYLAEDGFTESCMLNGFAGETVKDGMLALRSLLNVKTPEYVVWCLGMNNADGGSAVSPSWKIAYDELVGLSNSYGFELILATIPNTPTVNNTFKNDIVKNSGYRYIDFSNAVNVPNSNTWYSGMLANDNVHPTASGAKSLYGQVLADFPEITSV